MDDKEYTKFHVERLKSTAIQIDLISQEELKERREAGEKIDVQPLEECDGPAVYVEVVKDPTKDFSVSRPRRTWWESIKFHSAKVFRKLFHRKNKYIIRE